MARQGRAGWMAAVAAVVGMILAGSAFAAPARGEGGRGKNAAGAAGERGGAKGALREPGGHLRALREELDLTPEQKQQIAKILKGCKDALVAAVKDVHAKRQALREAIRADQVDEQKIRDAADALGKSVANAAVLRAQCRHEIFAVLTPEQRTKIEDAVKAAEKRMDEAVDKIGTFMHDSLAEPGD